MPDVIYMDIAPDGTICGQAVMQAGGGLVKPSWLTTITRTKENRQNRVRIIVVGQGTVRFRDGQWTRFATKVMVLSGTPGDKWLKAVYDGAIPFAILKTAAAYADA